MLQKTSSLPARKGEREVGVGVVCEYSSALCGPTLYKDEMTGTGASTEKTDETTTTHKTPREDHRHHQYRRRRV